MSEKLKALSDAAVAAVKAGRLEEALRLSLQLEAADPHDPGWPRRTAKLYRRLNRPKEEVDALNRAARLYEKTGDYLKSATVSKQLLEIAPRHPETLARIEKLRNAHRQRPGATTVRQRPPPKAITGEWERGSALSSVTLKDAVPGATRDLTRSDDEASIYTIPLEDIVEEGPGVTATTPLFAAANPDAVTEQNRGFAVEDAAVLAVEEEFRLAEQTNKALSETSLFAQLPESSFGQLLMAASIVNLAKEQTLFRQGEPGDQLYVIAEGTVGVIDEGPPRRGISKLKEGDFFGEIALLTDQPRSATILALTDAQVIAIDRGMIHELIEDDPGVLTVLLRFFRNRSVERLLAENPLFQGLSDNDKIALGRRFSFLEVEPGALLVRSGTPASSLLVLLAGTAEALVERDGKPVRVGMLGPSDVVGEMSILTDKPAMGSVRATTKCFAIELPRDDFLTIVRARPQAMAFIQKVIDRRAEQARAVLSGAAVADRLRVF